MPNVTLPYVLRDGAGYQWDVYPSGSIIDGTSDAYDGGLYIPGMPYTTSAVLAGGGRELQVTGTLGPGIAITRHIHVSADQPWARYLEVVTNTTGAPVATAITVVTNLGSDGGTYLIATSSGDLGFSVADRWLVTDDYSNGGGDPTMLHAFGQAGLPGADQVGLSYDDLSYRFTLSLQPGETAAILHFASQQPNRAAALAWAQRFMAPDGEILTGITAWQRNHIVNYTLGQGAVFGDDGDDVLHGTLLDQWLLGGGGADALWGYDGHDTLAGGEGDDTLFGGNGDDRLMGGAGIDTVVYSRAAGAMRVDLAAGTASGEGEDVLETIEAAIGSAFDDRITGNGAGNRLTGGAGDDTLDGGGGADTALYNKAQQGMVVDLAAGTAVGDGSDVLINIERVVGSAFDDEITGTAGDNWLTGLAGDDTLDGGAGSDTASFFYADAGVVVDLAAGTALGEGSDVLIGIENAVGSEHADVLLGTGDANRLIGNGGDDRLAGGDGDDWLRGDEGSDTLEGGSGTDTLMGGAGGDALTGGDGDDALTGADGDDSLDGGAGLDSLEGGTGSDVIAGGDGNDTLVGEAGDDRLAGGAGNDVIAGGSGIDTIDFSAAARRITVSLDSRSAYGEGIDQVLEVENIVGSGFDDVLWGDGGANVITGGGGQDMIVTGAGLDVIVLTTGGGQDTVEDFDLGLDRLDVRAWGIASFAEFAPALEQTELGVVVRHGGDSVLLSWIGAEQLTEAQLLLA